MQAIPKLLALSLAAAALAGCSALEVAPAGPDTYTVAAGGGLGWTASSAPVRAKVYRAANDFCEKRGLVMVPVSEREIPGEVGRHTASVELVFRALPHGDPGIKRPNLAPYYQSPNLPFSGASPAGGIPALTYHTPSTGHWIKQNIDMGKMILLEDGSLWQIDPLDKIDAALWLATSNVTITESHDGGIGYDYLLVNSDERRACHAKFVTK